MRLITAVLIFCLVNGASGEAVTTYSPQWFGELSEIDYPSTLIIRSEDFTGEIRLEGNLQVGKSFLKEVVSRNGKFCLKPNGEVRLKFPERKLKDFTTFSLMVEVVGADAKVKKILLVARAGRLAVLKLSFFEPLPENLIVEFRTKTSTTLERESRDLPGFEGPAGWTIQHRLKETFPSESDQIVEQLFEAWPLESRYYMFQGRVGEEIIIQVHKNGYQIRPAYGPMDSLRPVVFARGFAPLVLQRLEFNPAKVEKGQTSRQRESTKKS